MLKRQHRNTNVHPMSQIWVPVKLKDQFALILLKKLVFNYNFKVDKLTSLKHINETKENK